MTSKKKGSGRKQIFEAKTDYEKKIIKIINKREFKCLLCEKKLEKDSRGRHYKSINRVKATPINDQEDLMLLIQQFDKSYSKEYFLELQAKIQSEEGALDEAKSKKKKILPPKA